MRYLLVMLWGLIPTFVAPAFAAELQDCPECPVMVSIPAGSFFMGTALEERLIDPRTGKPAKNDSPQHEVTLPAPFALGKYEVTVAEFGAFVADTGYETTDRCMEFSKEDSFSFNPDLNWNDTGFKQAGDQPVVCVSYLDALAYAEWLSSRTGQIYRLPTEAEWEYAARAGANTVYHWGTDAQRACDYANVRSQGAYAISKRQAESDLTDGFPCDDHFTQSSPVGSFTANDFGLYDVQGTSWEWVVDCSHKDYEGAPTDGSAWIDEAECQFAVIRGGSYINLVQRSSTTVRAGRPMNGGATNMGFRVARGGEKMISEGLVPRELVPGTIKSVSDTNPSATGSSAGSVLFEENCAACHIDRMAYMGIYGKDQQSLEITIRNGGNNVMSMPAFADRLTETEITELATYVREINGWK
jgi:formylglycine-generating enzyme required for sulfatase activity